MLFSDQDIRKEIDAGRIALEPYDPSMIQPASVDVRIDRFFRLFDNHKYPYIDPSQDQEDLTRLVEVAPDDPFILHPGEFVLGATYEKVTLPDNIAARLEGKSSLGRLGLLTHSTAGFIDPGFSGHVTLELCSGPALRSASFASSSSPAQPSTPTGQEPTATATRASAAPPPRAAT